MTKQKGPQKLRCIRSGLPKNQVEIMHKSRHQPLKPNNAKKSPEKYPIAKISRHKKTTIRELAYSACFVIAGEDAVSSASMCDFLIQCLLRFPSLMVSASNAPVAIERRTV